MKGMVGFLFFMLFIAAFALVLLQGRQMAESSLGAGGASLTGIEWRPVRIGAEAVPDDAGLTLSFAVDGSINGNGGCNAFSGSLERHDGGVSVGPLRSTRRACPAAIMERESTFLSALQNTTELRKTDRGLQLLDDEEVLLVECVAAN